MAVTCYDVLAVGPDATDEEIETAFRRRARETHLDVSDHADATERFRLLARARTTLLDAESRARYDRLGHDAYADRAWSEEFTATWLAVTAEWVADRDGESGVENPDTAADSATTDPASATDRREGADDTATGDGWTGTTAGDSTTGSAAGDSTADSATADHTETSTATDHTSTSTATDHTATSTTTEHTADTERTGTTSATAAGADSASISGGTSRTTAAVDDAGLFDAGSSWVDPSGDAGRGDTEGFGIRNVEPTGGGRRVSVGRPDETELLFAVALWIGYPFFLFGSVAPTFPLVVNVTLGVLTLILVCYALVRPAIGLGVFGAWSVLAPAVVALWNVDAGSVVLPAIVGACWLPFVFALLVAYEFG
ncbi:J domain-containing protein [Salinirubrum litoreum]|uniref:DnaJ domain-containing protein n=1 Tax=Salinirubrum litoreum TaxID=1126234 RepID=A0ABD5R826_9EURY|nr:J domain-containing protein [Salinirubrum litoreum]